MATELHKTFGSGPSVHVSDEVRGGYVPGLRKMHSVTTADWLEYIPI
jgi:hypothetical protein